MARALGEGGDAAEVERPILERTSGTPAGTLGVGVGTPIGERLLGEPCRRTEIDVVGRRGPPGRQVHTYPGTRNFALGKGTCTLMIEGTDWGL